MAYLTIGFSTVERVEDPCTAKEKVLTEKEMKYLEELYSPTWLSVKVNLIKGFWCSIH
jgi:hypothetical protein